MGIDTGSDSKGAVILPMCSLAIVNLTVFILCIIMAVFSTQVKKLTYTDVQPVTQIAQDWQAVPYVDIELENYNCPNSVFYRDWLGTERGCYENRWIRDDYIRTYEEYRRSNDENDYCDDIYANPGMTQTQFLGKYFCGVAGGKPFN